MEIAYILALVFAVGRALITVFQKQLSKSEVSDWKIFSLFFYGSTFIPAAILYFFEPYQLSWHTISLVFPSSVFFILGGLGTYYGLFKKDVSIIGGLQSIKVPFVALFAFFLLKEVFSPLVYVFMVVLIIGSVMVVVDEDFEWRDIVNGPILVFVLSLVAFALSDVFAKRTYVELSPTVFFSINLLITTVLSLFLLPFISIKTWKTVKFKQVRDISLNALLTMATVFLIILAFEKNVTIVNAISNLTGTFVLLFTIILDKLKIFALEKHTSKVYRIRILGVVISYIATLGMLFL